MALIQSADIESVEDQPDLLMLWRFVWGGGKGLPCLIKQAGSLWVS